MAKIQNPTKVITGVNTRWSYANVWDAKSINGGAPKYSVSLIIPKSDTVTVNKINAAIEAAYEEGQSKLKGNGKTVPALSILKTPLRDGDLERPDDPAYANAYFINANSASAPGIVDADRQPLLERSEVYSGVYGRASINLYAFNSKGLTEARRRANKKYNDRFVEIKVRVTPEKRAIIKDHAEKMGESATAFINRAIDEAMKRDQESNPET